MTRKSYYAEARRLTRASDRRSLAKEMRRVWRKIVATMPPPCWIWTPQTGHVTLDAFSEQLPVGSFPAILRDDC